jgi:hypothetical protein
MKICLIVDGYSTGKHLVHGLQSYGFRCIHIQSSPNLPKRITSSFKASDYLEALIYQENIDDLLKNLKKYEIILCLPGSESGVELADILCEKLALPNNGTKLSVARRNKYEMIETLSKAGLKTASHFKSAELQAIKKQIAIWGTWPMV